MYKLVLILKYLRRKLGPMFAALAVTICTMMVIIVISVMGGFLTMLQDSAQQLTGDVSVMARSLTGFAHYEELQKRLQALPEVEAVTPVVSTFGLVNISGQTIGVNIMGIEPESFAKIVRYEDTLQWSTEDVMKRYGIRPGDPGSDSPGLDLRAEAMDLRPHNVDMPGMVIGIEVNPYHFRDERGKYSFGNSAVHSEATLTVLPLTERGAPADFSPPYANMVIVNEFKSGLYDIDKSQVFVRFDVLQSLLGMDRKEVEAFDPEMGEALPGKSVRPARTSELVLRGADGYTLAQVDEAVQREVMSFAVEYEEVIPPAVRTWRARHAQFINAVKNEKGMVTFLFGIIGIVAVVMVATTLYMTVLMKTRDIGVLRAVGASEAGILGLFLGYGLVVGIIGALAGLGLALAIVWNLNEIQFWLANSLGVSVYYAGCVGGGLMVGALVGVTVGYMKHRTLKYALWFGLGMTLLGLIIAFGSLWQVEDLAERLNTAISFKMWDPQTYFFDRIPDKVDFFDALFIVIGAIIASVIGALIPAALAALLDPIEALRYE